jgi:glycosyltransferase involved in cell wall biosynthesis
MRVLINALSARQGGGQTYLYNLLSHIPENVPVEVCLLAPSSFGLAVSDGRVQRIEVSSGLENPLARALWEKHALPRLARALRADVLFCPGGIIGARILNGCRTVTMFRNMIPFDRTQRGRYRSWYERLRNWLLERAMLKSMIRADLVIFISQFAKGVIEARVPGGIGRSVVVPHGIGPRFRVDLAAPVARPAWLPQGDYFLYVSTLDVYKAQLEVVRAYHLLRERRATPEKLVLVGPENPEYGRKVRKEVEQLGLSDAVFILGPMPYGELPGAYQHARINLFASESENCPNVLLEALAAGRPVVCSERPPMPEFAGDAAVYFDPASASDLAEKLGALADDPARMTDLARRALQRSRLYSWEESARLTWRAIAALAAGDPSPAR